MNAQLMSSEFITESDSADDAQTADSQAKEIEVLQQRAQDYFEQNLQKNFDDFMHPLDDEASCCGPDLRETGLFSDILQARKADDPNLPQGDWQVELKRADWSRVTRLSSTALLSQSKDLQLSIWLLEAEIKQRGFSAIAPCVMLIHGLLGRFWQEINPPIDEIERRYNLFRWIDEKLPYIVNQITIASSLDETESITGFDFDKAQEREHLIETNKIQNDDTEEETLQHLMGLVARTSSDFYIDCYLDISQALSSLELLDDRLDESFGRSDAPGLSDFRAQLQRSLSFVETELGNRGILDDARQALLKEIQGDQLSENTVKADLEDGEKTAQEAQEKTSSSTTNSDDMSPDKPVIDRQNAYQQLADIAHYLANIEPHSPVPYLVMRAVEWGGYNTAELYQDLFLVNKGQIDLFEIMGITAHQEQANASA